MTLVCVDDQGPWEKTDGGADSGAARHLSCESVSEPSNQKTKNKTCF